MKRLLFLFFFCIIPIFSSSPHLVDVLCSSNQGVWFVRLYSGTSPEFKDLGWQEKILMFDKASQTWKNLKHIDYLSSVTLINILEEVREQQEEYEPISKEENPTLHKVGRILKAIENRDPVRLTTFHDNVSLCLGRKQDLLSLLTSS